MINPLFDTFTGAMFIISSVKFLNTSIYGSQQQAGPPRLRFYESGLIGLLSWLGMVNAG